MQVLYLGRSLRTKETLPDFREKCRVARHSRVFRGLTGSQRTPGFWGLTKEPFRERKCDFSLDFPAFGPSVLVKARSKVVLRGKGYAWAPILWSSDNSKR